MPWVLVMISNMSKCENFIGDNDDESGDDEEP